MMNTPHDMRERLDKLERQHRLLVILAVLALLIPACAYILAPRRASAGTTAPQTRPGEDIIRARALQIIDDAGQVVIELSSRDRDPRMTMNRNDVRISLGISSDGSEEGPIARLTMGKGDTTAVRLEGAEGQPQLMLRSLRLEKHESTLLPATIWLQSGDQVTRVPPAAKTEEQKR